jgi:hypothetical protein
MVHFCKGMTGPSNQVLDLSCLASARVRIVNRDQRGDQAYTIRVCLGAATFTQF